MDKFLDLPWNDERSNKFITNVGLITSDGPSGASLCICSNRESAIPLPIIIRTRYQIHRGLAKVYPTLAIYFRTSE
jgi:hypothetical protein